MAEEDNIPQKKRGVFATKTILLVLVGVAVIVATTCFIVVAFLPRSQGPFDAPLRSFLTGLGLLSVAFPPYVVGLVLKKRAAASPYFELGFIRTGFNIIAIVCLSVGLTCIGLSVYALIVRAMEPH